MVLRQPRLKPGICTRDRHHHLLSCPACPAAALLARLSIAFSQSSAACVACRPRNVLWWIGSQHALVSGTRARQRTHYHI